MFTFRFAVRIPRVVIAAALAAAAVSTASAATIVDSHGFETPFFSTAFPAGSAIGSTVGQLEGQTPATFNGTWTRTKIAPNPLLLPVGTATVENSVVDTGLQAVKVVRPANAAGDDRWGVLVGGYPANRYVCIEWSMLVLPTNGASGTLGPFFGMEAYDTDSASIGLLGSLGVDASNGEVLYQQQNTGYLTYAGATLALDGTTWHDFDVELDYQLHQYRFWVDNVLLGTQGFVDQNNVLGGLNEFTDANISALAAAGDPLSRALGGTAYFDNFHVEDSTLPCDAVVPEPSAAALALIGLLGWAVRRRAV